MKGSTVELPPLRMGLELPFPFFKNYVIIRRQSRLFPDFLLLKTEMNAGHGGKSGRDGAIEEIAFDYSFILKMTKKI